MLIHIDTETQQMNIQDDTGILNLYEAIHWLEHFTKVIKDNHTIPSETLAYLKDHHLMN